MSDRERDSIQEMEDIQKGLEAFLQQEMQEMQTSGSGSGKSGTGRRTAERPAPQMFDMTENDEDEEALDLIKFQNSYNLASKCISVLSEMYDQLILNTGV